MVDAEPFVPIPSAGLVIPIGVEPQFGVQGSKGIGVPEMAEGAKAGTGFWTAKGVVGKSLWIIDVMVCGTHVKVSP